MNATRNFGKVIRTLGLMGIMMALAGLMASAPAARASNIINDDPGKLTVYVPMPQFPTLTPPHASLIVWNTDGQKEVETEVTPGTSYATYLAPGDYKVYVTTDSGDEYRTMATVNSNENTMVKASFARPNDRSRKGR